MVRPDPGRSQCLRGKEHRPKLRQQMAEISVASPRHTRFDIFKGTGMPDRLSIHGPVLVNTIGHSAGAVIFGTLLYLFVVNWRRGRRRGSSLPAIAAALAMLWNVGSLVALASGPGGGMVTDAVVAASFSVLSLLPGVLLHISLGAGHRALWRTGYILSFLAVILHISDLITRGPRLHYAALMLVTLGFGAITVISVLLEMRQKNRRAAGSRLAAAMLLLLFAISFVHFSSGDLRQAWSSEIALHHAGLPLALLVLLQDYRFLLLDTFIRFIVNASLAAGAVLACFRVLQGRQLASHLQHPFDAGLLLVAACLLLILFVYLRNRIQSVLTRVIFLRTNVEDAVRELRELGRAAPNEAEFLSHGAEIVARFVRAEQFTLTEDPPLKSGSPPAPTSVLDPADSNVPSWVHSVVPLRLSRGDTKYLLLGPRKGGRRYLSEDYEVLSRLASAIVEHTEELRSLQMQNLVSQAEMRALQSQMNPHFLFNSLNTLYGTIARDNAEARRLVLNLADVFRYFLQSDRPFIRVEEELKIVRAYLEIEELRLGSKLRTEVKVDNSALGAAIPVLSIQPLVENAVKHGVAARAEDGFVRILVRSESGSIRVDVTNSGEFLARPSAEPVPGIGLANLRRRLALYYGKGANVEVRVAGGITTVGFAVPISHDRETEVAAV